MKHVVRIRKEKGTIYKNIPLINRYDYFIIGNIKVTFLNNKFLEVMEVK